MITEIKKEKNSMYVLNSRVKGTKEGIIEMEYRTKNYLI